MAQGIENAASLVFYIYLIISRRYFFSSVKIFLPNNFLLTLGGLLHRNVSPGGQLAQLVEHRLHTAGVTGSSPVLPTTKSGAVVKTVITPACHAGGRGFKSLPLRQKVEEESVYWLLFFTGSPPTCRRCCPAGPPRPPCLSCGIDAAKAHSPHIRFALLRVTAQ